MKSVKVMVGLAMCLTSFNAFAFGAIAVDDEAGSTDVGYGVVVGMDTKEEAKAGALKECKSAGNSCKVALWFKQCGAYANSKENSGIGYGDTKAIASKEALDACGSGCKVQVAECE